MAERVFVGMSGGVDSALAAALLVERGYDVTGVYMRNWSQDLPGFRCPWADDLADAERVAVILGIDLEVWDYERQYREEVVDSVVRSYEHGMTPNPDVICNDVIKFGSFALDAFERGADYIATGHYARVGAGDDGRTRLLRAADEHKDQTYFLWRVNGEVFSRTIFPIGDIPNKAEVRAMCAERGLGVESKPDSDGICFIGPVGMRPFLLDRLERRRGDVVEWETGCVLGHHDGAFLFTVGQRRGLDLGGGPARYVIGTDTSANIVYVTANRDHEDFYTDHIEIEDVNWFDPEGPDGGECLVRLRHTGELHPATVHLHGWNDLGKPLVALMFKERIRKVAKGQSAVVYRGLECLGGGVVC